MTVYVFCHNSITKPRGGVRILFMIAEGLKRAGYDAKILIPGNLYSEENPDGYKPSWFKNDIEVIGNIDNVTSNDIVFIHEEATWAYYEIKKHNPRHIMINQGAQHTMCIDHISYQQTYEMYTTALGVLTVSEYVTDTIHSIFNIPYNKIHTLQNIATISTLFKPGFKENKILVMNKGRSQSEIYSRNVATTMMLKIIEGRYPTWKVQYLTEMPQDQVAQEMASSKIFVFFCNESGEGFGLPPAEAALSGCKVIGYSGVGGREFWKYPNFTEIEYNDVNKFTRELDYWVSELQNASILEYSDRAKFVYNNLLDQRNENEFYNHVGAIMENILNG